MATWYRKSLGDSVDASLPIRQIQDAFLPLFASSGQPIDMAIFSRLDFEANVVTIYFSPGASHLARIFGATVCEKPPIEDLRLIGGDVRCMNLFFPDKRGTQE